MRNVKQLAFSRRAALISAASAMLVANTRGRRPPRVLFVCEKGTVKSPIARELLRSRAKERGIAVAVQSRGVDPGESATAATKTALAHDGIDTASEPLRRLTPADLGWADIVVIFHPLPAASRGKGVRDWTTTPSANNGYAAAMADITARIDSLLDELVRARDGIAR